LNFCCFVSSELSGSIFPFRYLLVLHKLNQQDILIIKKETMSRISLTFSKVIVLINFPEVSNHSVNKFQCFISKSFHYSPLFVKEMTCLKKKRSFPGSRAVEWASSGMVHRTFPLCEWLNEVDLLVAYNLKILGICLLKVYCLTFFIPIGHIAEHFSRRYI
jgi:hypothetical protein